MSYVDDGKKDLTKTELSACQHKQKRDRRYEGSIIHLDGASYLVTSVPTAHPGYLVVRAMSSSRVLISIPKEIVRRCVDNTR